MLMITKNVIFCRNSPMNFFQSKSQVFGTEGYHQQNLLAVSEKQGLEILRRNLHLKKAILKYLYSGKIKI